MSEKFLGLQFLEKLTNYDRQNHETILLEKHFPKIADPFENFLQFLQILKTTSKNCHSKNRPTETEIIAYVLEDAVGRSNEIWFWHHKYCSFCRTIYSLYQSLIRDLWKALGSRHQEISVNIILAYLQNDPPEEIAKKFKGFSNHDKKSKTVPLYKIPTLKGILVVKQLNEETGDTERYRYGLVRKSVSAGKGTICKMYPENKTDLEFRIEFTDEHDQFYFKRLDSFEINGGLHFYFGPKNQLIEVKQGNGLFAQHTLAHNPDLNPGWEAIFCGIIN